MPIVCGQTWHRVLKQMSEMLATRGIYHGWPIEERDVQTRYEAETLIRHITGMSNVQLVLAFAESVTDEAICTGLSAMLERRLSGEPLAYITGHITFYGREFRVRPGCLIPRPETEILVESAAAWVQSHLPTANVYDLGCGSGIISISMAFECPAATVVGVDISADAVAIARDNASCLDAKVAFRHADGLADLARRSSSVNVLVSNPPYIPTTDIHQLDDDVKQFEPHIALDGGVDGLDYYRALLQMGDAPFVAGEPAAFFWEVGIDQATILLDELKTGRYSGWSGWTFRAIRDLRGVERVVCGERGV